ncbi:alpha/beta fold hydrolase [Nocardia stercoris]|uniref:Alpha/beta hydrolase n=1 Tax=Nocardia stercoris TaxID=2483361 RepID=A0A3M2KZF4_9NOCA|nr:alpha/beta hydrolase [Nocardia stercoris]RMI28935.1 alpha/beta hydrolase [Nocardia stercoris]
MPHTGTTVVLVHGAFVDGSSWRAVYDELTATGHTVRIVQHSTRSLHGDADATCAVLDDLDRPAVLVGQGYGGAVITEAGLHEAVTSLVYLAAFAPDTGESVETLLAGLGATVPRPPILPPVDGGLVLDRNEFRAVFAADLAAADAAFLADAQVPWGVAACGAIIGAAAWRTKPSWYLQVTGDRMIPPSAQLAMAQRIGATVAVTSGSHAVHLSRPAVVADLIRAAAR